MSENTIHHVLSAARLLFQPGDVVEVRVPKAGPKRVISGYFEDLQKLAEAVNQLEHTSPPFPGIYWTLNPVMRDLLARADHKLVRYAPYATMDGEIVCRLRLPIDLDPKRPAGISSTDAEHNAALELATKISSALLAEGWPEPIFADSGNGGHLVYAIDLPNDEDSTKLVKGCLEALAQRFSGGSPIQIDVDRTTFNASRIFKIYGTTARKGDHIAERPHRLSRILKVPAMLATVPVELLQALAMQAKATAKQQQPRRFSRSAAAPEFDLRQFLDRYGISYRDPVPYDRGYKYTLEACPFDPSHQDKDAAVFERPDGYGFKCFHNSCANRRWTGKVELIESKLTEPLHWKKPRRVFVNSMSDLFHENLSDEAIDRVFAVIGMCDGGTRFTARGNHRAPNHTMQILTKRAARMRQYCLSRTEEWAHGADLIVINKRDSASAIWTVRGIKRSWLGVSVEDQHTADARIPELLRTPAALRFVSYEPALGPVDFRDYLGCGHRAYGDVVCPICGNARVYSSWLDWIIVGGESGPDARPCRVSWVRSIIAQCRNARVPCFMKQYGARPVGDMETDLIWITVIKDRKGGNWDEWPEEDRVREFPASPTTAPTSAALPQFSTEGKTSIQTKKEKGFPW